MRVRIHAGALLIALAAAASAHGASVDCQAAHSPVEHRICDDAALGRLDTQLNDAYHAALARAADAGALAREQRAWLAARNRCADAACLDQAVAGQCFRAVAGDGRHAVVADTQGIVDDDDATARSLASLTFLK